MRLHRPPRGFTLIEMSVAIGILGIIITLGYAGYQQIGEAGAPVNAHNDFSAALNMARTRAVERNADVWLIIYPGATSPTNPPPVGVNGGGAYVMIEDPDFAFGRSTSLTTSSVDSSKIGPRPVRNRIYLDDYAKGRVAFGFASGVLINATGTYGLSGGVGGCSFCTSGGSQRRGAIVFNGEGGARFMQGDLTTPSADTTGYVGLMSKKGDRRFIYSIVGQTGFIISEAQQ